MTIDSDELRAALERRALALSRLAKLTAAIKRDRLIGILTSHLHIEELERLVSYQKQA